MAQGLQISLGAGASALSPEQKRFNTLIRQIEQARQTLAAWHESIPLYAQAHVQLVVPLIEQLEAGRRELAFALDRVLGQPGWTKAERALMRELVCDGAAELLDADDGEADPALKALFDKHSDTDFDTEQQQTRLAMKDMVEAMTGMDLGDDAGIASDEELFKRLHEGLAAEAEAQKESAAPSQAAKPRRRSAAQQQREADAQLATQSIREIFRKLASALHPDRETDPVQRAAKTALMQKVNQAYAANDLLTLLEVQLQIEQVDASHVAGAGAQRLKQYNKVLAEQLAELKHEVERVEAGFRIDFGFEMGWGLKPNKLIMFIEENTRHLRAELATRQREMRMLEDKAATKRWLKRYRQRLRNAEFDGGFF